MANKKTNKKEQKVYTLSLEFSERMYAHVLYPEKTNFTDGVILDDIRNKWKATQEDITNHNVRTVSDGETSQIMWDDGDKEYEYEISELELDFLIRQIDRLSEDNAIPSDQPVISMCRKIYNLNEGE